MPKTNIDKILEKVKQDTNQRGHKYAYATVVASALFAFATLTEEDKLEEEAFVFSEIPKEILEDAIGILDIFTCEDCNLSINEAADIYFAKHKAAN